MPKPAPQPVADEPVHPPQPRRHAGVQRVDAAGEPASGAFVTARYFGLAGGGILERLVGGQPLTDSDGVFALDGLVPDTPIALQAARDGSGPGGS